MKSPVILNSAPAEGGNRFGSVEPPADPHHKPGNVDAATSIRRRCSQTRGVSPRSRNAAHRDHLSASPDAGETQPASDVPTLARPPSIAVGPLGSNRVLAHRPKSA